MDCLDEKIEHIIWPITSKEDAQNQMYKVVQIELDSKPYMIFSKYPSDVQITSHSKILNDFLVDNNISFNKKPSTLTSNKVPSLNGECYKVVGMGYAMIIFKNKVIYCLNNSDEYKLGIDTDNLTILLMLDIYDSFNVDKSI